MDGQDRSLSKSLKCSKINDGKVGGLGAHAVHLFLAAAAVLGHPKARGWAALQGTWSWCRPGAKERIGI